MNPKDIAKIYVDQFLEIEKVAPYKQISQISMIIGSEYNLDSNQLEIEFEDLLEDKPGCKIDGAIVNIRIVSPGDTYNMPSRDDIHVATGWEILINKLDGIKQDPEV